MRNLFSVAIGIALLITVGLGFVLQVFVSPKQGDISKSRSGTGSADLPALVQNAPQPLFSPLIVDSLAPGAPIQPQPAPGKLSRSSPGNLAEPVSLTVDRDASRLNPRKLLQGNQNIQRGTQFDKVDFDGQPLPDSAYQWSCARDRKTGLLWETKLFNAGISDTGHRYSWYAPDRATPGYRNNGSCYGIECDTHAYAEEMNRLVLCGSTTWRLPSFAGLESLLDRDFFYPVINQNIFTYTEGTSYWTGTQLDNNPSMIMQINFFNGSSSPAPIHFKLAVRLVSD